MTTSWRNSFVRGPQQPAKNARTKRARLGLERLEDRTAPAVFAVSLAGNDASTGGIADPFRTVQRAINAAAGADDGNDEIRVQAGAYNTPGVDLALVIPASDNIDNLTITGGFNVTFDIASFPPGSIYIPQSPGNINAADVDVFDDNVTIRFFSFVFDGLIGPGGARSSAGILSRAANFTLVANGIEAPSSSAAGANDAYGFQTLVGAANGVLNISSNTWHADAQFASGAIYLHPGTATSATVSGNTISGSNLSQGIVADTLSNVAISSNNISRTGPADAGFQQLIFAGPLTGAANQTNVNIRNNTLDNNNLANSVGIEVGNTSGNGLTISDFTIAANPIAESTLPLLVGPAAGPGTVIGTAGDDTFILNPPLSGGLTIDGDLGSDTLIQRGTLGQDLFIVTAAAAATGSLQVTTNAVPGPASLFTGMETFEFQGMEGDDTLRINNPAGGLFAPVGGIFYEGGGQPGDSLENLGGAANAGSYTPGPTSDAGTVQHVGAVTQTIQFTGLAPATDTVVEPTFTITANAAANNITLDDGTALGDGLLRVSIDATEPMQFANKTNVVVDAGAGADTIDVVYTEVSTGLSTVTFNGEDGTDFLVVRATPAGVITTLNGDSDNDLFLFDSNGFAAGGTLNGILGPVTANGGDNDNLSTVSLTAAGVTTTLPLGDRVLFVDTDNPAGQSAVYALSDTLFQRISNSPGGTATGLVTFATVERIDLLTGAGTDDILVSTTRDQTTLIVSPGGGDDTVTVQNTGSGPAGAASIVFVDGGAGADTIDVQATGANSAVLAAGGAEDDVITFDNVGAGSHVQLNGGTGADTLNVRATAATSATAVFGEAGNDTINLGSVGDSLDAIQGRVGINGGANDPTPTVTHTVTCDGVTVSTTLAVGDTLNLNDQGDGDPNTYRLNGGRLERNGVTNIFFGPPDEPLSIETINLNAGAGTDDIVIETTPDATTVSVNAGPTVDFVTVQNTGSGPVGAASLTVINAEGGSDVIDVLNTGANSVTVVNGGDELGPGDFIRLHNNGAGSGVELNGQSGPEQINVFATSAGSATVVTGGAGNDQVFVGNLGGTLDTIQGVICVDGQGDAGAPGDLLALDDAGSPAGPGGAGNTYTIAADTVTRTGVARVTFAGVERLALNAGQGSDTIDVTPGLATTIDVDGNLPTPPASPGDTLNVDTAGTTNPVLTATSTPDGFQGSYTFADRQPVNFQEIETLADTVDLRITKDDAPDPVVAGTVLTYTIVVSNPGTLGVAGATVADLFPAALTTVTFTSVAAGGATGNTPAGAGDINDTVDLPAGSSITYTVTGTVAPSATGTLSNTATVTPPSGVVDSAPGDNSDTEETTIVTLVNLVVTKTDSPDPVLVANNITYTITLRNEGPSDALTVSLSDVVPARTTFVSFTAPAGFTSTTPPPGGAGTVTSTTPVLAAGAEATFTLVVRVNAQASANPPIVNTVTVSSATPESSLADNADLETTQIARVVYVAVGAAPGVPPRVRVFSPSGATVAGFLAFNRRSRAGVRVAVGDVNADGVSDIIVAQGRGARPSVKIVDGTKLAGLSPSSVVPGSALLAKFFAYQPGFGHGVFVAAGDVNGDGREDIVVGPGGSANARVKVIDAARLNLRNPDGSISSAALHGRFLPYRPRFAGGISVGAGDVDGNDLADVLVGPATGARAIKVIDGARLNVTDPDGRISSAAVLARFFAYAPSFAGGVSLAADFVNADNRADVITGPGVGRTALVKVIDGTRLNQVGANGQIQPSALLARDVVFDTSFRGPTRVGALDLDNDGLAEILAGFGPTRRQVLGLDMLQDVTQLTVAVNFDADSLGGNS